MFTILPGYHYYFLLDKVQPPKDKSKLQSNDDSLDFWFSTFFSRQ